MFFSSKKLVLPTAETALPGRETPIRVAATHAVLHTPLQPFPGGDADPRSPEVLESSDYRQGVGPGNLPAVIERMMVGMGCFWGAERKFWQTPGVVSTAVGYAAGLTPNPTYEEVCSGGTGHNEVVLIAFDPSRVTYDELLKVFWESHDPTQGMQQGNDRGTQYRSGLYTFSPAQQSAAEASQAAYQDQLVAAGHGPITTEVLPAPPFFYAEDYHQQYLHKNPNGYCGLGGTGVSCPVGIKRA